MSATPVDGHSDEFEQLAGLAALDVLEADELDRFERHAAQCERCQVMVRLDREALAAVSLVAAPMDPSPDFKARLMRRAAEELAVTDAARRGSAAQLEPRVPSPLSAVPRTGDQPGERPIPLRQRPPNVIPLWRRSPWISALAAVLVVGLVSFGAYSYENQPVATYELSGSAPGKAVVIVRRSGMAELVMEGVPDPEPGFLYEAWIIPQGGQPLAAGTTTRGNAEVPLPGNVRGTTVAITKEPTRVDAPTTPVLMSTVVES
jgi:anti-sigma-K factor RskA